MGAAQLGAAQATITEQSAVIEQQGEAQLFQKQIGNVFRGMWGLVKRYPVQTLRGSVLGTAIGALPGAGADIAAWMSYAMSKKFSKQPTES